MEATTHKESFITKNWEKIFGLAGLLFVAGGAYSEFKIMNKEIVQLHDQVDALRRQVMDEVEQRVDDLEEWKASEEGYKAALNQKNQ